MADQISQLLTFSRTAEGYDTAQFTRKVIRISKQFIHTDLVGCAKSGGQTRQSIV
jgi:hypothetical protein